MKTYWTETEKTERFLLGLMDQGEALVYEARLLTDPQLREQLDAQRQTYALIQAYHRQKLKREIAAVHERLFNRTDCSGFRERILRLFKKQMP